MRGREVADHLFAIGHAAFGEFGWAMEADNVSWLSTTKEHKTLTAAYPDYSLHELVDPTDMLGSENVVRTLCRAVGAIRGVAVRFGHGGVSSGGW